MKLKLAPLGLATDLTPRNAAIAAALAAANGRASAHTAAISDLIAAAHSAEEQIAALGLPPSRRIHAKARYVSGSRVPSTYKYKRLVTVATLVRGSAGWFLTDCITAAVWPSVIGGTTVSIPASADEYLVAKLRNRYAITRSVGI